MSMNDGIWIAAQSVDVGDVVRVHGDRASTVVDIDHVTERGWVYVRTFRGQTYRLTRAESVNLIADVNGAVMDADRVA